MGTVTSIGVIPRRTAVVSTLRSADTLQTLLRRAVAAYVDVHGRDLAIAELQREIIRLQCVREVHE